jgi:hypothetical protein
MSRNALRAPAVKTGPSKRNMMLWPASSAVVMGMVEAFDGRNRPVGDNDGDGPGTEPWTCLNVTN